MLHRNPPYPPLRKGDLKPADLVHYFLISNSRYINPDKGGNSLKFKKLFLIMMLMAAKPAWAETLTLNTAFDGPIRTVFESLMKEALGRNGFTVSVQSLPAERAIQQANSGMNDGDGPRVAGLDRQYPDLIQVPEKLLDMEFVGFSKNAMIRTDRWESLKPYRIGIIRGWKILESNIVGTRSLEIVGSAEALFNLLEKDRIDIAVTGKAEGLNRIREQKMKNIRVLNPPLAKKEMFLYLHKKHEKLVPEIAASLKDMKREGKYNQIADPVLSGNQE